MLSCNSAVFDLIQWRHISSAVPNLTHQYVYSTHCASVPNQQQQSCNVILFHKKFQDATKITVHRFLPTVHFRNRDKKSVSVYKCSRKLCQAPTVIGSCLFQSSNLLNKTLQFNTAFTDKIGTIPDCSSQPGSAQNSVDMTRDNCIDKLPAFDVLLPYEQLSLPSMTINNKELSLQSSALLYFHQSKFLHNLKTDKQPADDPREKIRLLTQQIRFEGFTKQLHPLDFHRLDLNPTKQYLTQVPKFMNKSGPYHDFSLYTKHIELYVTLKRYKYSLSGMQKYKAAVSLFRRFHLFYLSQPDIELLSLTTHEDQGTIEARWRISGWTPFGLLVACFTKTPIDQSYYDYSSTLYVNKSGEVWRHDISKMQGLFDRMSLRDKVQDIKRRATCTAATMTKPVSLTSMYQWKSKITCNSKSA